jgi:hypothetical protein
MIRKARFKMSSNESISYLLEGLMDTAKQLMRKIDQNPAEIAAKEADLTHIRTHLKRILWNKGLTLEEALKKVLVFYYLSQRKFVSDNHIWQKWISCWDYNLRQLCAIFAYIKRLPPGTIILSPIAGNCLLEAVLERMGFTVISNDIKPNGFTFHSPATTVNHKDGLHFLQDFVKENPGQPFVLLMSWAPQAEGFDLFSTGQKSTTKDCSSISVQVMEFATKSHNCQCVFHISEGRGGCTDVSATFDVIDRNFREIWRIGRYQSFYEKPKSHNPVNDQLFCLIPKKRE